jgi:ribosomal protein S18 acetylase RimI-like enzyme
MNIRIALSNDWANFREIRLVSIETDPQAFGGDLTEEKKRQEPEWRNRLESNDQFFFVAEDRGDFVSMAGAKKINDIWTLVGVYTRPIFRGKGFAQKLIEMIVVELKKRGVDTIQLIVNVDQKDAIHIYERVGFEIIKTITGEKMSDGQFHDEYCMEKKLS